MHPGKVVADKLVGYVMLALGVAMILFAVRSMYSVFTDRSPVPPLITVGDIGFSVPAMGPGPDVQSESKGEPVPEAREGIMLMSGDQASKAANLMLWNILMFFVAYSGSMIGGLGVKLVTGVRTVARSEG